MSEFIHLRVHSQYSILDATPSMPDLVAKAKQNEMAAIALTDHGNLFGAVEFYKECQYNAIKPIIGCEFYVAPTARYEKTKLAGMRAAYNITLLAKNRQGYKNLCKLTSIGYLEGFYYYPRIDDELLETYGEGLICLTGSLGTLLAHEILYGTPEHAIEHVNKYRKIFKEDYYLDLQRHQMSDANIQNDGLAGESWLIQQYEDYVNRQKKLNEELITLCKSQSIPLVATNDVHYLEREDWRPHEILMNIQSGEPCELWEKDSFGEPKFKIPNPKRQVYSSHEYYFKSGLQMEELFADLPDAIRQTRLIADQCFVEIDLKTKHYPIFVPPSLENKSYGKEEQQCEVEKFLWQLCEEGIPKRYTAERLAKIKEIFPDREPMEIVRERLNYEMSIIVPKGMSDYLLIVWDFIYWAKHNNIPMGPGRGSGAGSIVLYLIGITDIEPLRFHLFFERFINPERLSYPDIDVDICMDKRGEVIAYTLQKYGKDNVAQIITFGTMKAKMALKDVGRVLSVPLSKVNMIAKLIPEDLNITLDKALEKEPDLRSLYENDQEVKRLFDIAKKLEGSVRNTGIHAAGIIISGAPLTDLIPVAVAKDSDMPVTQFSMKPVEAVGMLKVDFLGLKTLTAIQICVDAIKASTGIEIDWINLPLDNKPTFDLINQGKTAGIFQLESGGMQDLAKQLHLDKFEEIIAVGALYRPGPMDMIPSFINRKHGREEIENDHPWMKDILDETYGIMVYQEQVMQIASKLANFSLGEGDVLRRAMGKKDMEEMARQRDKFKSGALKNGIDDHTSMLIFDKMEKFAAYGFNKSHAAAYGYLSYVTAFLKANYPKEWMAALMTCDRDDLTKVAKFIRDCQTMGITILPPDVNEAGTTFQATANGIRFAMTGIKGVGAGIVESIVQERKRKGPFKNLYEFFKRMDAKRVGKKVAENLVEAGCFDFTNWSREALVLSIDAIHETAAKEQKEESLGIRSLFSLLGESEEEKFKTPPVVRQNRSKQDTLRKEKELLGFFLTGHPMDDYKDILQRLSCVPLRRVDQLDHDAVFRSAFIVESVQIRVSNKTQRKFAILIVSDGIARYELPVWSDLYEQRSTLLRDNQLLYAVLQIDKNSAEDLKLSCRWLDDLTQANEAMIEACDKAFDKAKQMAARFAHKSTQTQDKSESSKKTKEENKPVKPIIIQIDAGRMKLSQILLLKSYFAEHRGQNLVEMHFHSHAKHLATLHFDSRRGIVMNNDLKEKIQSLECVIAVDEK